LSFFAQSFGPAGSSAERECEEDLADARGIIEREIAEQALEAATAARERMMMDILEFGGWLHDECKQLSRRGRPPDPEVAIVPDDRPLVLGHPEVGGFIQELRVVRERQKPVSDRA